MRSVNSKLSIALHCLVFIYEYGEEAKVTSTLLSLSTGCNPVVIRNILSALKKAGILSVPQGTGGARLLLSPGDISLSKIYAAVNDAEPPSIFGFHTRPSELCPVGRSIHAVLKAPYRELGDAVLERMGTITLQDILEDYHKIPGGVR